MQTPNPNQPRNSEGLEAPARLISALKAAQGERLFVPPTVDEAILRVARRHLSQPERLWLQWLQRLRLVPAPAAVAGLLILVLGGYLLTRPGSEVRRQPAFARQDLNRDGHVDILDAFALARQLEAGPASGAQFDMNGDGAVDERDVATLAASAVKLEKGGRS